MTNRTEMIDEFKKELTDNILPFWMNHVKDNKGGFYGAVTNDLKILDEVPRSSVLCARILWTFSKTYKILKNNQYRKMADHAYKYLTNEFWDNRHGGLYWEIDKNGLPVTDRKHHYAQAFGIYGLTEYFRITEDQTVLDLARELFHLLEEYAYEPVYGGYIEGRSRTWQNLPDMRLSDKDMNSRKSMNTMLHVLEAYSNLLKVWDDPQLRRSHKSLIEIFNEKIINQQTGHFKLFFDDEWNSLSNNISFGHDIEGSWLLWEGVNLHDNSTLKETTKKSILKIAHAVLNEGQDKDGSIFSGSSSNGLKDTGREWWPQAEAIVGFYNAYQLTGEEKFAEASF
ncbi:MAG: AGE family epimerase/isomerase [Calditrichaceae bacterium]|nr:AGE family epimerase/isomerase [Calditrichaceae bacterium]RQV95448.1 MAG: N-acyl-D-glucosamine 2-epimerase [Calditrichota bacterium]